MAGLASAPSALYQTRTPSRTPPPRMAKPEGLSPMTRNTQLMLNTASSMRVRTAVVAEMYFIPAVNRTQLSPIWNTPRKTIARTCRTVKARLDIAGGRQMRTTMRLPSAAIPWDSLPGRRRWATLMSREASARDSPDAKASRLPRLSPRSRRPVKNRASAARQNSTATRSRREKRSRNHHGSSTSRNTGEGYWSSTALAAVVSLAAATKKITTPA